MAATDGPRRALAEKMSQANIPAAAADAFLRLYARYRDGETGKVPWAEVAAPHAQDIVDDATLPDDAADHGRALLDQLVVIKLNGGLGTSMQLQQAKSLIPVRDGKTFLDLTVAQIDACNARFGVSLPLVLMNSPNTHADTRAALGQQSHAAGGTVLDFVQPHFPRIDRHTGGPVSLDDHDRQWAPAGHGDIYLALKLSGLFDQLLARGVRWAFVSNIDNLAATPDPRILGHLAAEDIAFAMEVTDKTLADIKGGTLVRTRDRLSLLERAQVETEHLTDFEDIRALPVFNTNNLWWQLKPLKEKLDRDQLDLPLIVNPKSEAGVELVQLETAMGAAIGAFDRAIGVRVPRARFAPVKTTADLLAVRSDAYQLAPDGVLRPIHPERPPLIRLDAAIYQGLDEFDRRFPFPLHLRDCQKLSVIGDIFFGRDVTITGNVTLQHHAERPATVPDGAVFADGTHQI